MSAYRRPDDGNVAEYIPLLEITDSEDETSRSDKDTITKKEDKDKTIAGLRERLKTNKLKQYLANKKKLNIIARLRDEKNVIEEKYTSLKRDVDSLIEETHRLIDISKELGTIDKEVCKYGSTKQKDVSYTPYPETQP